MSTQDQINSFHQFALQQLSDGEELSIDELYDTWRTQNATPEDLAAVQAAIDDMQNGDRGMPLEEHVGQMREKHKIPPK
jgi:hypothetical protein